MKEKRKEIKLIIGIVTIMLLLVSVTYAYFQAQTENGSSSNIVIKADTVDTLTFHSSNDIEFKITQENFKEGGENLSGTTTLNAHLIANNTNNTASYKYNVYLDITQNNFVYTKNSSTPELVLVIRNPNGQYESSYKTSLGYSKTVNLNGEEVTGYDITTKIGLIEISLDYLISATPSTKGEAEQNWEISVVFVNLESNQVGNAGRSFSAKAKVQSEKINVLGLGGQSSYYKTSTYRDKIKNVKFVNYIASEEELSNIANWDLSSLGDKSIMGWLKEENEDETAPYTLYIGSNLKEGEKIIVRSFANAFYYMSNLETVDLNLEILDTSNLNDTSNMFYHNSKLTEIIGIEGLDVTNVVNMSHMFYRAESLTKLDLSNWDTHNVIDMSYMFYYNSKLTEISGIEDLDVSNVTNMSYMFSRTNLTTLDISNWDTSNVTDMSYMFYSYKGTEVTGIEDLDVSKVTNMSYMFAINSAEYFESKISELDLSKWDTSSVTNMSNMFNMLTSLITLNLNNWDTSQVTNMSHMFSGQGNRYFMKIKEIIGIEDVEF